MHISYNKIPTAADCLVTASHNLPNMAVVTQMLQDACCHKPEDSKPSLA